LLNPELYKEMEKKGRQMRDPIFQSLKNIKERHTYLENRQQRIDKRNAEIAKELQEKKEEQMRLEKIRMLGK
jgi:chromosome segregation ATPase